MVESLKIIAVGIIMSLVAFGFAVMVTYGIVSFLEKVCN